MSEWQPIETAPKDGGQFLVWIYGMAWPAYRSTNGKVYSNAHGLLNAPDDTDGNRVRRCNWWTEMLPEPPK